MDAASMTVVVHGAIATLLAAGGGYCLFAGFKLLFGKRLPESKSTFSAQLGKHKLAFSTGAAGTAVVFTSAMWVLGAVAALPSYSQTNKGTTVAITLPYESAVADLDLSQIQMLDAVGPKLAKTKGPLLIEGFAYTGNKASDMVLRESRAEAVRKYLVNNFKVPPDKISVVSYGEEPPISGSGNQANAVV